MANLSRIIAFSLSALACYACSETDDDGPADDLLVLPGSGDPNNPLNVGNGPNGGGAIPGDSVEALRESSCAGWVGEPEGLPAVLQLVVDVSASMAERTNATNGRTKWEITRDTLGAAINDLPASTALGVLYYPNLRNQRVPASQEPRDVSTCVNVDSMLDIALLGNNGSAQRRQIQASLDNAQVNSSTPTHDAYEYALVNGLESSRLAGSRFMLLITDGAPTFAKGCVGDGTPNSPSPTKPIEDEIAAARSRGIRTFVIGSPGSEVSVDGGDARPWLSRAATLGGTAASGCSDRGPNYCHIDLTQAADFGAALRSALAAVAGHVVSCNYTLPEPPRGETLDLSKINVIFTPSSGESVLIGRTTSADCKEGFRIDDQGEVALCEETCNRVQADAGASLELLFGCASEQAGPF